MEDMITWAPEGSRYGLGTVQMRRPTKPLGLLDYEALLAARINRLVEFQREVEGEDHVQHLMNSLLWDYGRLVLNPPFKGLGELLIECSDQMLEMVPALRDREMWPVPPEQIQDSGNPEMFEPGEDSLEDYLGMLFR